MVDKFSNKSDCHGKSLNPLPPSENSLSTGQIGGLIIEMNAILCNEFYPFLGKDKIHWFNEIWEAIQGFFFIEAISTTQDFTKAACDLSIKLYAPFYTAVIQAGLISQSTARI